MKYYRCKCGKSESWGSLPPRPCEGCEECNTTLASHPDYHRSPDDHTFVETKVKIDGGHGILTRCQYCHKTKDEIMGAKK